MLRTWWMLSWFAHWLLTKNPNFCSCKCKSPPKCEIGFFSEADTFYWISMRPPWGSKLSKHSHARGPFFSEAHTFHWISMYPPWGSKLAKHRHARGPEGNWTPIYVFVNVNPHQKIKPRKGHSIAHIAKEINVTRTRLVIELIKPKNLNQTGIEKNPENNWTKNRSTKC